MSSHSSELYRKAGSLLNYLGKPFFVLVATKSL